MEDPRWTTSPEQLMQARHASNGVEEEKDEYELAFDAIDADINLDESTRENPLYALSGHSHSVSMNGTEGVNPQSLQRPGDRWGTNTTSKPAAMTLKEQEKVGWQVDRCCATLLKLETKRLNLPPFSIIGH
jgi:hypothetical protein